MKKLWLIPLLVACCFAADKSSTQSYEVKHRAVLGGEGGWDYLSYDPASHHLYVTHGTHVIEVDPASGKQLADIPDTPRVHGVVVRPEFGKGFISAGGADKVVVFDTKTNKATGSIPVGKGPDAIIYEPATGRVFTFNGHGGDATAIDPKTEKVVGSVPLGGKPEFAVADGKGHIFGNIEDTAEIVETDAKNLKVLQRWKLAGCEEPSGLAIDLSTMTLFSGCANKTLVVFDAKAGKPITTLPIGEGVDAVVYDPAKHLAFSSNGDGTLTVIGKKDGKYSVLENVTTQRGARTEALNPETHEIYLVTADIAEPPKDQPAPRRPSYVPNTFTLLTVGPK